MMTDFFLPRTFATMPMINSADIRPSVSCQPFTFLGPPLRQRAQLDRDLGIARDDFLDPKRLAFELFGSRLRTTRVIGVLAGALVGWNRWSFGQEFSSYH